ncbi:MAG TPA: zf-HC2 domain-containing protein [Gemmatimonadales bacterium]
MDSLPHLTEADLAGYLDRDLEADRRRQVELHLEWCDACRADLVAAMRLASPDPAIRVHRVRWAWVATALAAGLAAVMLVRPPRPSSPESPEPPVRASADRRESLLPMSVVGPADNAVVPRDAISFTWRPVRADFYRVTILSESGEPVWSLDTPDTTVRPPASVGLRPGRSYFWQVEAIADGVTATSGARRVQVAP